MPASQRSRSSWASSRFTHARPSGPQNPDGSVYRSRTVRPSACSRSAWARYGARSAADIDATFAASDSSATAASRIRALNHSCQMRVSTCTASSYAASTPAGSPRRPA